MLELATLRDRDAVNALARQVHALHVGWRPDIFRMPEGEMYTEERFLENIQLKQLFVAKLDGAVVGYVVIKTKDRNIPTMVSQKTLLLEELCVDETLRGHGLGTCIMEDIYALAKYNGCDDMQLNVYPQNDEAVGFYQKCGFTIKSIDMQRKV